MGANVPSAVLTFLFPAHGNIGGEQLICSIHMIYGPIHDVLEIEFARLANKDIPVWATEQEELELPK